MKEGTNLFYEIIKFIIVFIFVYIIPLVYYLKHSPSYRDKVIKTVFFSIGYIIISLFVNYNLIPFILVVLIILNMAKEDMNYSRFGFSLKDFKLGKAVFYSISSYAIIIMVNIISAIIIQNFNIKGQEQEVVEMLRKASFTYFLILGPMILIFAPVVEEFVFRYFLFEKIFTPRIGVLLSALLSSIFFALTHFNLLATPILLTVALINSYLIHKKGYWYAVFNHFIFNSVSFFSLFAEKFLPK